MNPDLELLQPYPFEKLAALKAAVTPDESLAPILLSIGEPKHPSPEFVRQTLTENLGKLAVYPTTRGLPELRQAIADWCTERFSLQPGSLDGEHQVLPVNGTREAIFAFTQCAIDRSKPALLVSPNPFYQIYEGAAYLAGAKPHFLPSLENNRFIPDYDAVPESVWQQCQILFLCSPGNPTGAVTPMPVLKQLIELADRYDFIVASDECYSEIYCDESNPPVGLLEACRELGRHDYRRCMVFHSLSKRSNLPGLRSGFVAGDATLISAFLKYRTYHGCAMPIQHQLASIAAWQDEDHVRDNREQYRAKFDSFIDILSDTLPVEQTDASFYLWLKTPVDDETFAQQLFAQEHITVLPGSYLSRTVDGINPGANRVRIALVAPLDECREAAHRIRRFVQKLSNSNS